MEKKLKILFVEDVATDAELVVRVLHRAGISTRAKRVETEAEFRRELGEFAPDIILSDFSLPGFDGMSALTIAREQYPTIPFIFVSGAIGEERAIESLKCGAVDYVLKENLARLAPAVQRAIREVEERAARRKVEQKLRKSERCFSLFMHHLPGIAFIKDLAGRYVFMNSAGEKLTNKSSAELIGHTTEDLWPAEIAAQLKTTDRVVIESRAAIQKIEVIPQDDGLHSMLVHKFPILADDGQPYLLGGIAIDITERIRAEESIAHLNRLHAVLSGINSAIIRIRDRQELFQETCRIAVEHGKFSLAWIGLTEPGTRLKPVACMDCEDGELSLNNITLHPKIAERVLREKKLFFANGIETDPRIETLARGYRSLAMLPLLVNGDAFGVLTLYATEPGVFNPKEIRLLDELASDISFALAYIAREERLNYLAYYDALTGLPNRTLFCDRLNQLLHATSRGIIGVLALDLERFRVINDTLGRHAGDILLKLVAERLKEIVQNPDGLARLSADCFALAIPNLKQEADMAHCWERKINTLFQPFSVEGEELRIAVKAGIALFPSDGDNAETLLSFAEAALKKAKTSQETYLFYTPEINAKIAGTLIMENRLRKAVEAEQFTLHYQPKLDLASGCINGLEALIRWNDPHRGLVLPALFIPMLEETRLILSVGRWALRKALSDYRQWLAAGLEVPRIAVNVSAIQLRHKDFVAAIAATLKEGGLEDSGSEALDLEVTESLIMENIEDTIAKLKAIQEMGLHIAVDDFGTGYSSLSYIAKLPVNALKIDRVFITDMAASPDALTIVSTIITLAHALNLKVIAEGVETQEQADLLRSLKCDEVQGYLLGRPVPPEIVAKILPKGTT